MKNQLLILEFVALLCSRDYGELSQLVGKPVRLRFVLQDADVFSIQRAGSAAAQPST